MRTYWRIQHSGYSLSRSFRSSVQDGSGMELATSAAESLSDLLRRDSDGSFDSPRRKVDIVHFSGELVGYGADGEPIVSPEKEVSRWRHKNWSGLSSSQMQRLELADRKSSLMLRKLGWSAVPSMRVEECEWGEAVSRVARGEDATVVVEGIEKSITHLYHATYLHRARSIASKGLLPSQGGSSFSPGYSSHSKGKVFLTDWKGVSTWFSKLSHAASQWHDSNSPEEVAGWLSVVLRIETQALDIDPDDLGDRDALGSKNFSHKKSVPARKIRIWNGDRWVRLSSSGLDAMMKVAVSMADENTEDDGSVWYEIDEDVFTPRHP